MTSLQLAFQVRQALTATPRLQHSVRLLQLSSLDLAPELRAARATNPFLEVDARDDAEPGRAPDDASSAEDEDRDASPLSHGSDGDADAMERIAMPWSLRSELLRQAGSLRLPDRDRALVGAVIDSLDDDGYLRLALDEVALSADLDPSPDATEMRTALNLVQAMEPSGVGARDLRECLLLQLGASAAVEAPLAIRIVAEHLDRLARRDETGLARLLQVEPDAVAASCRAIRRLDPRPGLQAAASLARLVTPDVVVRKRHGHWAVQLQAAIAPRVRVNARYAELLERGRTPADGVLRTHLQEARWLVRNVERRRSAIRAVAEAIVARQRAFLEHGPMAMKPLALRDVARAIGVHESTVCRITNGKFMATPGGVFELKHFFSRAVPMRSGATSTGTAVRQLIADMIAAEPAQAPLSDVDLTQRLARQGLRIARRTVTKHRHALRLPSADLRRGLAAP